MERDNAVHDTVPLFCGRAQESQFLREAYQRSTRCVGGLNHSGDSCIHSRQQELVLIQGHSGTGKTTLANSLVHDVIENDFGFFLSGKFELCGFQNPYEVFVSAFAKFPEMVQSSTPSFGNNDLVARVDKMRQAIREAVGTEGKLLSDMIPSLIDFIGQQEGDKICIDVHGNDALHRLKFVFSRFIRAISSVAPLVLFLDDLQWSDPASLGILQAVLESQPDANERSYLLVICAFRDDGIDEEARPPLSSGNVANSNYFRDFLKQMSSSTLVNVNKIALSNLDAEATRRLIADYLDISQEASEKLAPTVFAKCGGNPFHLVQLLSQLVHHRETMCKIGSENYLTWEKLDIVEIAGGATVDELLRQRISSLPQHAQEVLKIAACMGDSIDHPALCTVFDGNLMEVENSLQLSLKVGFLVFDSKTGQYRFAHDRVRQAVISIIEDVNVMSFQIGHQLWTKSTPMFLTHKMFVVVSLLNHGTKIMTGQDERYRAAAINLEAGSKAVSMSAFQDAARFLGAGIDFLTGGDYWNDEYELSLDLFSAAADAELCNQNFHRVSELVKEVFQKARTVKDKLPAYVVQINSLGQRCNLEAATQVGIDVMKQLGEPLPYQVTNTTILFEIIKTRIALRGRSNETLLALPPMQEVNKIACMYVLTNLLPYTFQASSNYVVVIATRLVRLCLQYGMHKWSANGFSAFGFVLCTLNRKEGYRLGQLALTIIERYGGRELLPRVYVNFYGLVNHWMHPLEESLDPLEHASKVGMEVGDVEHATLALSTCATYSLYKGKPLTQVVDVMLNEAIHRMRVLRQDGLLVLVEMSLQYVHTLTGQAPLAELLSGNLSPLSKTPGEVDSVLIPYSYYFMVAELAFLFGDVGLAAEMLDKNRSLQFEPLASYLYIKVRFIEALICVGAARSGLRKKKETLKIAKADLQKLKAWAKDCPQNYLHKQRLVQAELMSVKVGRTSRQRVHVQRLYDMAIDGGVNQGFVQEAALANELAGDFMCRQKDHAAAREYWNEAHSLYTLWGATEKANSVLSKVTTRKAEA